MTPNQEIQALKQALREAVLFSGRKTIRTKIDYSSAGSSWDVEWAPHVLRWATFCDLDLSKCNPPMEDF